MKITVSFIAFFTLSGLALGGTHNDAGSTKGTQVPTPRAEAKPTINELAVACRKALEESKLANDLNGIGDGAFFTVYDATRGDKTIKMAALIEKNKTTEFPIADIPDDKLAVVTVGAPAHPRHLVLARFSSSEANTPQHWVPVPEQAYSPEELKNAVEIKGQAGEDSSGIIGGTFYAQFQNTSLFSDAQTANPANQWPNDEQAVAKKRLQVALAARGGSEKLLAQLTPCYAPELGGMWPNLASRFKSDMEKLGIK